MSSLYNNLSHALSVNSESVQDAYENDPYRLLAAEIVISAVEDWRKLIKSRAWEDGAKKRGYDFDSLRFFLKSGWCEFLMQKFSMTPATILTLLENELEDAKNASAQEHLQILKKYKMNSRGVQGEWIRQRDLGNHHESNRNQ